MILLAVLLVVIVGALAASHLRRLSTAETLLAQAVRRLAAGDFATRVRITPLLELQDAGIAVNQLAARIESSFADLSRDKTQLSAVLNQMTESVVAVDADGIVLLVNPALSRLLSVDPAAARGRRYLETLRHNGIVELLGRVLHEGRPIAEELRIFAPEELVFDGHAAPLVADGKVGGALLVLHDITRLRRLENVRRDFVANVSHELRTPLASIKGFAETLRSGAVDDRENRMEFLRTIEDHADRLTKLVDDLLNLSAIESGHRAPKLSQLDLVAALLSATRTAAPVAEARGVDLKIVPGEGLPRVLADADQLKQILANLLDNALKYTDRGGVVELSAEARGAVTRVTVRDTGVGIPDSDLPRVFERFYRVDKARGREAGGTGLGLSIVKHLVEAQGGEVSVESRQPGGSSFHFTLRAA